MNCCKQIFLPYLGFVSSDLSGIRPLLAVHATRGVLLLSVTKGDSDPAYISGRGR